ncbi:MAG: glycosyltransferase family 39 protein [Firmicutes bacterium]|nr:glycosyltransferase family 39 protein [Bacillota bacterium]
MATGKSESSGNRQILSIMLFLIILCGVLFFLKLGGTPLLEEDEPRNAEAAREMIQLKSWVTPYFNFAPRYEKPVMIYWLMIGAYKVFGVNEFSARFWSAVFAVLLVIITFLFVKRFLGIRAGLLSAIVLATSSLIVFLARFANTDMTLIFFITSSLYCFFLAYSAPDLKFRNWYYGMYAAMGFAALTKGPVGIGIPAVIILIFLLLNRDCIRFFKEGKLLTGILLFLLIAVPWYALMIRENGMTYVNQFFIGEHIKRYSEPSSGHGGNLILYLPYYIGVIALTFFPWSGFLPFSFLKTKNEIKSKSLQGKFIQFNFVWLLFVFALFTLSETKLPHYIAPLFPAMAIFIGKYLDENFFDEESVRSIRFSFALIIILGLLFTAVMLAIYSFAPKIGKNIDPAGNLVVNVGPGPVVIAAGYLICGLIGFILWKIGRKDISFLAILGGIILSQLATFLLLEPAVSQYWQAPWCNLAEIAGMRSALYSRHVTLAAYDLGSAGVVYYSKRHVEIIDNDDTKGLKDILTGKPPVYVITKSKDRNIFLKNGFKEVSQDTGSVLLMK